MQFAQQREFSICPNADDPDARNGYKDLKFPPEVYEQYYEQKAKAS